MTGNENKIRFKDLNIFLKIPVILGWGLTGLYILSFMIGYIIGLLGL